MARVLSVVLLPPVTAAIAVVLALVALELVHRTLRRIGRHRPLAAEFAERTHRPAQLLLGLAVLHFTLSLRTSTGQWREPLLHAIVLAGIAAVAWLVAAILLVIEDGALARIRTDVRDNRTARRVHTQVIVIRRVTVLVATVVAVAAMMLTFPTARAVGASLLASAAVAGVIAGVAAQTMLRNVFAGLQLAFSDALRLDDVVVVEGEWGRVEAITLTYVVVRIWDDRRLVLPSSYFTEKPFQNWTRNEAAVMGTVLLEVDWSVPIAEMREQLVRILRDTSMWDERTAVLQVTDAARGNVEVRCVVSAQDAPTLWDLRCLVREKLVEWVRRQHPEALPRLRLDQSHDVPVMRS
jgi:small-conductance mechanosensitive channel